MAKLSPDELKKARKEMQTEARNRVAQRGILQFRADAETVLAVLKLADEKKVPVGSMLRDWVRERLITEGATGSAPNLVQRVSTLEEEVKALKRALGKKL